MRNFNFIITLFAILITIRTNGQGQQAIQKPDLIKSINADLPLDQIRGAYGIWYKNGDCKYRNGIDHANKITGV